jgi:hypothetical protein
VSELSLRNIGTFVTIAETSRHVGSGSVLSLSQGEGGRDEMRDVSHVTETSRGGDFDVSVVVRLRVCLASRRRGLTVSFRGSMLLESSVEEHDPQLTSSLSYALYLPL